MDKLHKDKILGGRSYAAADPTRWQSLPVYQNFRAQNNYSSSQPTHPSDSLRPGHNRRAWFCLKIVSVALKMSIQYFCCFTFTGGGARVPCIFITIICYEEHIFISCTTNCTMAAVNYYFCQNKRGRVWSGGWHSASPSLQPHI